MAYCATQYCYECGKSTMHTNGKCNACERRKEAKAKAAYFKRLDGMTIEQRLREIETRLYNSDSNCGSSCPMRLIG